MIVDLAVNSRRIDFGNVIYDIIVFGAPIHKYLSGSSGIERAVVFSVLPANFNDYEFHFFTQYFEAYI